jgi:predicted nucleotidyltransferase
LALLAVPVFVAKDTLGTLNEPLLSDNRLYNLSIPNLGIIIPNMGLRHSTSIGLAEALFPAARQRVLGILFGQPDRSFYGAELIRLAGSGTGAVQRELTRLARSGLVSVATIGSQKHYRANRESPIFPELRGLILKTVGLSAPLKRALAPFKKSIRAAFVYGSVAQGRDTAKSDIDLMVIAEGLDYQKLYAAIQRAEANLRRPVNPTLMTLHEWNHKLKDGRSFVVKVNAQPKIFIVGSQDVFA